MFVPDDAKPEGVRDVLAGRRVLRHELRIAADDWHALVESEWRGALVLLECGDVEAFCVRGGSRLFREGAVLCFDGIGVRALHNPGPATTVLAGYRRAPTARPP